MKDVENQMKTQHEMHVHHQQTSSIPVAILPPSPVTLPANQLQRPPITRPKSESAAEITRLRQEYKPYVDDLLDWTAAQEGLDIYQLNAFYSATHEISYYWRNYWKTICVQFIQTAGLAILLYHDWLEGTLLAEIGLSTETKGFCDANGPLDLKLLSFFLLSFLSIRLSDQIATMADYGLYSWGDSIRTPHFVNWGWIAYGLLINYITLISSFFISGLVVYNAQTPLDMILDFVALYFIIELDDEMVSFNDYKDIEEWLTGDEDIENSNDSPYEVWLYGIAVGENRGLNAVALDEDVDDDGYDYTKTLGKCAEKWDSCGRTMLRKITACKNPTTSRYLMLPLVIIMPVYVLICY